MRLFFFDGASTVHKDTDGNMYAGHNLACVIQERYRNYCDKLSLLLVEDTKIYSVSEAKAKFDVIDTDIIDVATIPSIYEPRINFITPAVRKKIIDAADYAIQKADRVIVRAPGRFGTNTALKLCRKYNKPYMIEAVDFVYEFLSYGTFNKFFAPYCELKCRREIARAPYVMYVSQNALQERYPTSGKSLGCSDVGIPEFDHSLLEKRLNTPPAHDSSKIIFGTAAAICKLKGQEYIVRALAELRKQGITNIEYHLAGDELRNRLHNLVHELHLEDCVKFFGTITHNKIFDWYDHLDVYIQPSFTESLGRSVVEAMSRALPAACACVGGMKEYASNDLFFQPGNVPQICSVMKKLLDPEVRKRESAYSFTKAQEFAKSRLDPIRDKFYMDFINGN